MGTTIAAAAIVLASMTAGPAPSWGSQGLSVNTGSLPDGVAGLGYQATVTAGGGTAPYSWYCTNLPKGFLIDADSGVISGTTTETGTRQVTVTVSDQTGQKVSKTLSLTIKASQLTAAASIDGNKLVTVTGVLTSGTGQQVSVMITDPNGKREYMGDTTTTAGGKFTLSYTMLDNVTGIYKVAVGAQGMPGRLRTTFVYGATPHLNASIDGSNQVTVTGVVSSSTGRQRVSVMIIGPNGKPEYLGDTTTATGGHFSISYTMLSPVTGIYNVAAGCSCLASPLTTKFAYGNAAVANASINKSKQVTVSGFMGANSGQQVTVMVTDPNGETEYLGDTATTTAGYFSVSYTMLDTAQGTYKVVVGSPMLSVPLKTSFVYYRLDNADLKSLTISGGSLSQAFASGITAYTAVVGNIISSLTVTPTAANPDAVIEVNGTVVPTGKASGAIALNVGSNIIKVHVTAPDGITTKIYTITVTRTANHGYGLPKLAPPTAYPNNVSLANGGSVTLKDHTVSAAVYYTENGKSPTRNDPWVWSGQTVTIQGTPGALVTLKAMAVAPGYADSDPATFHYSIKLQLY